jgi:hypothetical protein
MNEAKCVPPLFKNNAWNYYGSKSWIFLAFMAA